MSHLFATTRRNNEFHELFKDIPQDELLIDSYSCALSREILIHGRLYLSANYICFNANILGWVTNIVLNLKDIVSVEKKMTALIIPNGISLSTLHIRHVYASFLRRDDAYNKICRVWRNCITDTPVPTTELLAQIATDKPMSEFPDEISNSKRYRERRTSTITDSGVDSIMSDDFSFYGELDPALNVRREYNFGSNRQKSITLKDLIDESTTVVDESDPTLLEIPTQETEEEQKEVRESILPCECVFHYKTILVDQLVLISMPFLMESLLFTSKNSLTSVPRAFQQTLKTIGAKEINFSPWKVYLNKWERRIWSCTLPARKLLLSESTITIKVTDSVIIRQHNKVCVESLMQIDGVPGGGCFVKWKLCATAPLGDTPLAEQCRITITAAAASPLGAWFKESIRSALLQHVKEMWINAIETAAGLDYSNETFAGSTLFKSNSISSNSISTSAGSLSKLLTAQNIQRSLSSVTLTYFDRKAFFRSLLRLSTFIVVLFLAIFAGNRYLFSSNNSRIFDAELKIKQNPQLEKQKDRIQSQYFEFLEKKLRVLQKYPEIMIQATDDLERLDGHLSKVVGKVYQIQRQLDNPQEEI